MSFLNLYETPGYKMSFPKRIKWWYRRWKFKWQRALWGFSEYDAMDMDCYLADLIGEMLLYRAKHSHSHFSDMSESDSQQWFIDTAQMFKDWNREMQEPAYEAYKASIKREKIPGGVVVSGNSELAQAWKDELIANYEYKKSRLAEGFARLHERFGDLWD